MSEKSGSYLFNKRGVSAVVATVLIIMITVAAVGIVWAVIIPLVRDNIGVGDLCKQVDVSIESSQGYTCLDSEKGIMLVQVKKGVQEANVSGLKFLLSSMGSSVIYSKQTVLQKDSYNLYYLNASGYPSLEEVTLIPTIKTGSSVKECSSVSVQELRNCTAGAVGELSVDQVIQPTKDVNEQCAKTSDCPEVVCQEKSCNLVTRMCEYSFMDPSAIQAELCVQPNKCDGGGNCLQCLNAGECAPSTEECVVPSCDMGVCGFANDSRGAACSTGMCDGSRNCVKCLINSDCPTQECRSAICSSSGTCEYNLLSSCNLFYENFDGDVTGWSHNIYNWGDLPGWWIDYGMPTLSDGWAVYPSTCWGTAFSSNTYGTIGNGCYASYIDRSRLVSPEMMLSNDYSNIEIDFTSFAQDEGGSCLSLHSWDSKEVGVSTDNGETWAVLNDCWPLHDYYDSVWKPYTFDLSAYRGQSIRLVFAYETGDSCCGEAGWDVDDILVRGYNV